MAAITAPALICPGRHGISCQVIENARNASAVVISRIKSLGPSFSRSSSDSVIDVSPNLNVDSARKAGETIPFSFGFGF